MSGHIIMTPASGADAAAAASAANQRRWLAAGQLDASRRAAPGHLDAITSQLSNSY